MNLAMLAAVALVAAPHPLATLKADLEAVAHGFHGRLGFYVKNLATGETIGLRENERFPSASTIKTVIMVEAIRQIEDGTLGWTQSFEVPPQEQRSHSMWLAFVPDGTRVNVEGLLNLMMNVSDNTAAIMLAERVGVEAIERRMQAWGFPDTACTIRPPASNARLTALRDEFKNMGVTTPRDMGRILERIYRRQAASPAACERMIRMMSHQYWDDFFVSQIPPDVVACSKVGALERSRSDTAIVFGPTPYIVTAYTDDAADRTWRDENEGHRALRKISSLVWNALNPQRRYTPPPGAARWYPTGSGVEG